MFPVPVILIGIDGQLMTSVRQELTNVAATVEAEFQSAEKALESFQRETEKKLFIIHFASARDAASLRRLFETQRGSPILALVEVADHPENLIEANRAGAMQVVPLPLQAMDLNKALGSLAVQLGQAGDDCRIIAFTGCAPGCGATTLATNAAYEMAVRHKQGTVLVELSQQTGVLATNLDLRPTSTLSDLLADPEQMDAELVKRSLVRVADHFDILAGNHGVYPPKVIDLSGVLRVLDYLRPLAQYVVLDVPCSYDEFQFEILRSARQIVLVGEQSISSIRTLKLILDTLRSGPTQHAFHVVMNRYDSQMTGLVVNNLEKALGLTNIRTIPDDRLEVLVAANEGKLLRQMNSNSQVLAKIDALVDTLLDIHDPSGHSGFGRFLGRFFKAFRK